MKFLYIIPRPIYNEQSKGRQEKFKRKFNEHIDKCPEWKLLIFDES
ncbi:hypothetical protein GOY07_00470 [Wolbachia endosymbiont of Litomosoides sigmodontis]|nr:hypothetical protein [Wolbachia endosymbiont of Litomosoides sigmodontis]QKX02727.1 hypothetical protein GOY07_00470 [Wolbachia endosymbiont of Litomosoides sigmodontis]